MSPSHGGPPGPPRLSRAVLVWAARRLGTPDLDADVEYLFCERVANFGSVVARRWYRRQARSAVLHVFMSALPRSGAPGHEPFPDTDARARKPVPWGIEPGTVGSLFFVLEALGRESRLALRKLRRVPAHGLSFALVVGVGIGAAAWMTQVRADMLRPDLGLGRDIRLVTWMDSVGGSSRTVPLAGDEPWLTEVSGSAAGIAPFWPVSRILAAPSANARVSGQRVNPGFLAAMGVSAARGRDLSEPGDIVLSHRLWLTLWSGDAGAIGASVELGGTASRVVGVAPPGFDGALCCAPPEFWTVDRPGGAPSPAVLAVAEPRDGAAAAAWLSAVAAPVSGGARADLEYAETAPYGGETGIVGRSLQVLLGLAVLAWLGTLLSGANLMLADTLDRRHELRTRRALGSHSRHLLVRTLAETFWLAVMAAATALGVSWIMLRVAPWFIPMVGGSSSINLAVGRPAFTMIAITAIAATLVCTLPAAIVGMGISRSTAIERGPAKTWLSSFGLGGQVALAATLLVVAGMFVANVRAFDGDFVGFRHGETAVHFVSAVPGAEPVSAQLVTATLRTLDPAVDIAVSRYLPVYGARRDSVVLPDGRREVVALETVTQNFFRTIGTALVAGDPAVRTDQAVVSEDLALMMAGSAGLAIGSILLLPGDHQVRVVGVVERATWGSGAVRPTVYRGWGDEPINSAVLLTRAGPARQLGLAALFETLQPYGLALQPFETLDGLLVRSRVLEVFLTRIAVAFGVLCMIVALTGIHAHFLRWVRVRRRTLAIRSALGAPRVELGWDVIRAALIVVIPGVTFGCLTGWASGRVLGAVIGGTGSVSVSLLAGVATTLVVATLVALIEPIARAGAVNPGRLLRSE